MLLHFLADRLGYTVGEMLCRMGSEELASWAAYYELRPPGKEDRVRAARLAYYAANQFKRPIRLDSLIQEFDPEPDEAHPSMRLLKRMSKLGPVPAHILERFETLH